MDLVSVMTSAALSAVLFLVLEFSVILPLFVRVVKKSVNDMVTGSLLPSVTSYIDEEITQLKADLVDSILAKIRGGMGGRSKGVNRIMQRLADGESLEDIEDDYQQSTIDQVLTIVSAVASRLPDPKQPKEESDGKKESKKVGPSQESGELLSLVPSQEEPQKHA